MKWNFKIIFFLCLLIASCKQVVKVTDAITKPSAREVIERDIKDNDSLFKWYQNRYRFAKTNKLTLELPSALNSYADSLDIQVLAYKVSLKRGERFKVESNITADSLQLALDIYRFENDSTIAAKPIVSNQPEINQLDFNVEKTGDYKITILSEQKLPTKFGLKLYTEPTLTFPVSGKGNAAIQSFWGAQRGGGTRLHKGIDIFAKRGTPVVAATDGFVSNTGNRGLGGKQVWLRDGLFGQSLYYAHLDSIAVSGGNRVNVGDTLGFVGNTGNAKTTAPHLHFGIYTRGGAVDPLPFVKTYNTFEFENSELYTKGITRLKVNELRLGAGVKNEKIEDLKANEEVKILGKTNRWLHLRVNDSIEGFMHETLVKEVQ
ncbi:peptidoglycan DD-metalloendopeptidase family protein [Lacinutrix chionoecetis]